jgi:hypothetical protein
MPVICQRVDSVKIAMRDDEGARGDDVPSLVAKTWSSAANAAENSLVWF